MVVEFINWRVLETTVVVECIYWRVLETTVVHSPVDVVVELVVTGVGEQDAKPGTEGEEHLGGRVHPYLQIHLPYVTSGTSFVALCVIIMSKFNVAM